MMCPIFYFELLGSTRGTFEKVPLAFLCSLTCFLNRNCNSHVSFGMPVACVYRMSA